MPRDASSIILRLNQEQVKLTRPEREVRARYCFLNHFSTTTLLCICMQDVEVAKEMEAALQLAVRNLGADPAVLSRHVENQRKGSRNDSLQRVSSARHIGAADAVGAEISPVDARHSRGRPLSWSRGNFSFSGFSIRGGGQFDTHNPMSASRAADSLCSSDVEMSVRPTRTKSAASESTDTSVKWRETLDVEFGVTDAARSRVTSDNDSDYPTWQRISKASLNISRNITLISND